MVNIRMKLEPTCEPGILMMCDCCKRSFNTERICASEIIERKERYQGQDVKVLCPECWSAFKRMLGVKRI